MAFCTPHRNGGKTRKVSPAYIPTYNNFFSLKSSLVSPSQEPQQVALVGGLIVEFRRVVELGLEVLLMDSLVRLAASIILEKDENGSLQKDTTLIHHVMKANSHKNFLL